jgi:transposase-like protein
MADKMTCPRCKKAGFVRVETVIARGESHRAYYCGACDRSWTVAGDGKRVEAPNVRPEPPDRSRPPQ